MGDFNLDGWPDLAVSLPTAGAVQIFFGTDGGLIPGPQLISSDLAHALAVVSGDFNRDGKPDLAISTGATALAGDVAIYLGTGTGSFAEANPIALGEHIGSSVAVGDFNEDGIPDLAVTISDLSAVKILLGVGDGTFSSGLVFPVGSNPQSVAVGDLNRTGHLDLVIGDGSDQSVSWLRGNGDGSFQTLVALPTTSSSAPYVAVADFNRDGWLDVATAGVTGTATAAVTLLINQKNGTFSASEYAAGIGQGELVVGDFNGDDIPDVAVATTNDKQGDLYLLLGQADGTLGLAQALPLSLLPGSVATGDFNRDGRVDLALTDPTGGTVGVVLNTTPSTATGMLEGAASYGTPGAPVRDVAIGDFNRDGIPDFVLLDGAQGDIQVFNGDGTGSFTSGGSQNFPGLVQGACVISADFNRDGILDLAVGGSAGVDILLGYGTGAFNDLGLLDAGFYPNWLAVGDFNEDGVPDLAVAGINPPSGQSSNSALNILLGDGDGGFSFANAFVIPYNPGRPVVGDLNLDGHLDVVVPSFFDPQLSVLLGYGDGGFASPKVFNCSGYAESVAIADVNLDGKPDLIATDDNTGGVNVFLGNGDGTFGGARSFPCGLPGAVDDTVGLSVADFNQDGLPDIAVVHLNPDSEDGGYPGQTTVSLLLGNGDGTFQAYVEYPVGDGPLWSAVGDFNRDGIPDLAVACEGSGAFNHPGAGVDILLGGQICQ